MDEETIYQFFFGLIFLLAFVVGVTSLIREKRRKQDYLMGVGALMSAFSEGFLALGVFGSASVSSDYLFVVAAGTLGLGMMLFAMGYLFDQFQTRRILQMMKEEEIKP